MQNECGQVVDLLREMLASDVEPNAVTLTNILSHTQNLSNLKGGKEIHAFVVKKGYDQKIYMVTAIVDRYVKLGLL